jgi:hypothetical protein
MEPLKFPFKASDARQLTIEHSPNLELYIRALSLQIQDKAKAGGTSLSITFADAFSSDEVWLIKKLLMDAGYWANDNFCYGTKSIIINW